MKLHNRYLQLKQQCEITDITAKTPTLVAYFEKAVSDQFRHTDELREVIDNSKVKHLDEILALKEKISALIDQNYKLHKEYSNDKV